MDFVNMVLAMMVREGDANRNLSTYLKMHIRPEFLRKINYDAIFKPLVSHAKSERGFLDDELFKEDIVDMFMDLKLGERMAGELSSDIDDKYGIDDGEAVVSPGGNPKDPAIIEKASKDFEASIAKFLKNTLFRRTKEWLHKKEREISIEDKGVKEPSVPSDVEYSSKMELEYGWEEGLIKGILRLINDRVKDERTRKYMKVILRDMLLAKTKKDVKKDDDDPCPLPFDVKRKTLVQVGEDLGLPTVAVHRLYKELIQIIGKHLEEKGLGNVKPMELKKEDISDFKDFVDDYKSKTHPMSADVRTIIKMIADGDALASIASKTGKSLFYVRKIKYTSYKKLYQDWESQLRRAMLVACSRIIVAYRVLVAEDYREVLKDRGSKRLFGDYMKKNLKPGSSLLIETVMGMLAEGKAVANIFKDLMDRGAKLDQIRKIKSEQFDPMFKAWEATKDTKDTVDNDDKVDEDSMPLGAFKLMIESARKNSRFVVTVDFVADFDHRSLKEGDAHFAYKNYKVTLKESRKFGKVEKSIVYVYEQGLTDDGKFSNEGTSKSELFLDDQKVKDDNELKVYIDSYIEDKIKSLGLIPHSERDIGSGKETGVRVFYKNLKLDKEYHGISAFVTAYRGLFIHDPAYQEKLKRFEQLRRKRYQGLPQTMRTKLYRHRRKLEQRLKSLRADPRADKVVIKDIEKEFALVDEMLDKKVLDEARAKDLLKQFRELLKVEKAEDRKKFYQEMIDLLLEDVSDISEEDELAEILQQEQIRRKPTTVLAKVNPPQDDKVKELVTILKAYGLDTKPNPVLWLEPKDLYVLARSLRQKVLGKAKEIDKGSQKDLDTAKVGFEAFPEDLKARRALMVKFDPEGFKDLSNRKDTAWVMDPEKLKDYALRIDKEFKLDLLKPEEKQKGIQMLEKSKYDALEVFLKGELSSLGDLMKVFSEASLKPQRDPKMEEHLRSEINKTKSNLEGLRKQLDIMKDDAEGKEEKDLSEVLSDIVKDVGYARKMEDRLKVYSFVPALKFARVFMEKLDYFKEIYKDLSRILWFRFTTVEKASATTEDLKDKASMRDKIITEVRMLSGADIRNKSAIAHSLTRIKKLLESFIIAFSQEKASYDMVQERYMYVIANDFEDARLKALIPADELHGALELVSKFESSKNKSLRKIAPLVKEELQKMMGVLKDIIAPFQSSRIKALAEEKGIKDSLVIGLLQKLQKAKIRQAFREFSLKWTKALQDISTRQRKERSPLGNRPHTEYDEMGKYIETHLPKLFEQWPSEEEDIKWKPGIPTPRKVREDIEEAFTKSTPEEMTEKYDYTEEFFIDKGGAGGGSGGKSKHRPKAPKVSPPSAVYEIYKDRIAHMIKTMSGRKIVQTLMAEYVSRLRKQMMAMGDEEFLDPADVIDGFVSLLKGFYYMILKLNVQPPGQFKIPGGGRDVQPTLKPSKKAEGPPKPIRINVPDLPPASQKEEEKIKIGPSKGIYTAPIEDIPLGSQEEAEELLDKLIEIYDEINHYIAPDKVGVPPESLKDLRRQKSYLPRGLTHWFGTPKKAYNRNNLIVFKVASEFTGVESTEEEVLCLR